MFATDPRNTDAVHDVGEHPGIGPLSSGNHGDQDVKGDVDSQVNGGQGAA
ncbi:hypothetical protein GCM10023237_69350 [Streptomyces coeruleoprunus]